MKDVKWDFVKGVAISFVIILHTLDSRTLSVIGHIWHIGQAVPLFILVTFVLSFISLSKREGSEVSYWYSKKRWIVMLSKIWVPYLILQAIFLVVLIVLKDTNHLCSMVWGGGIGPGSYYPWIYLQFWLVMPFLYRLMRKVGVYWGGGILLIINEILQLGCSYLDVSENFYRLFAGRYLFLAFLGYLILKVDIKKFVFVLSAIIGIAFYLSLGRVNYEPWLFNSWMSQQLPAYFYTMCTLKVILLIYEKLEFSKFTKVLILFGKYSWYIFLSQMLFTTITNVNMLSFVPNRIIQLSLYVILVYILCVAPIFVFEYRKKIFL